MIRIKLVFLLCILCFLKANAQEEYPVLNQIVTDKANLFNAEELAKLSQKLTDYETRTTHQIVVLTINDLGNNTIEDYAYRTFNGEGNQFGQKDADNGILILVAKNDREFRIEVGDGFTPIITDAFASRINRNTITPAFKDGDYYKGINDATTELIRLIDRPEYRDEFANAIEEDLKISLTTKFFSSFFLTLFFMIMGIVGYNHFIAKDKFRKFIFKNNKLKFFAIWSIAICLGIYFYKYLWYTFFGFVLVGFIGTFVVAGLTIVIHGYKQLINVYTGLITGKVSVLLFPILLIFTLLSIIFGLPFILMPLLMAYYFYNAFVNDREPQLDFLNLLDEPPDQLPLIIGIIAASLIFLFIPITIAYFTRSKKRFTPIKLSLFKSDKRYMSRNFSSGGVSSGRSSSYSSSSSRSSFSGGGGSSSGGGSSGSW